METVLRDDGSLWWEEFVKQVTFKPGANEGVVDDEGEESTEKDHVYRVQKEVSGR